MQIQTTAVIQLKKIRILIIAFILLTVFIIPIHLKLLPYAEDDAYIHFRIANNFVKYGQPYFNPNEAINASSSIGWTILLALIFKLFTDSPIVISVFNSLVTSLNVFVYTVLIYELTRGALARSVYVLFGVCFVSLTLQSSIGLMETPFTLFIFGIAVHLLYRKNKLSLILFGTLIFFRLEFAIFLCLVLFYATIKKIFRLKDIITLPLIGIFPFLVCEFYYFKTILPHTLIAKSKIYDVHNINEYILGFIIIILTVTIIYLMLEFRKNSDEPTYFFNLFIIFGITIVSSYIVTGMLVFNWYGPIFTVPLLYGLFRILFLSQYKSRLVHNVVNWISIATFLLLLISITRTILSTYVLSPSLYEGFMFGARVRKYIQVGQELYQKYPYATLLTSEIGGLGYGFHGYIADGAGLITPKALKYHPMKIPAERQAGDIGAIPLGYIEEINPELIVSNTIFIKTFLRSNLLHRYTWRIEPAFIDEDLLLSKNRTTWNNNKLIIFIRKDLGMY